MSRSTFSASGLSRVCTSRIARRPLRSVRVNDRRKLIEVAADKHTVTEGPAFDDDEEITRDHEARIYGYYGLQHPGFQEGTGGYRDYYASDAPAEERTGEDLAGAVDTEYGQRREESLEDSTQGTSTGEPAPDHPDTTSDSAGEQGGVRVYKRVRTGS